MSTIEIIGIAIGAIATILGGVWFILKQAFNFGKSTQHWQDFEKKISDNLSRIEYSLDKLPCREHHDDLIKVKAILIQGNPTVSNLLSVKSSPRRLTKLGEKIFADIKGDEFLSSNKDALFRYIDGSKPLVALDVEQSSYAACLSLVDTPAFNTIKNYIYNAPSIDTEDGKYDLSLADTCFVLGLKLRDMYLKEHRELI